MVKPNFPYSVSQQVHKNLRGSTARTSDLSYQGDIPYHRMSWPVCEPRKGSWEALVTAGQWARHHSAGAEQLFWACHVSLRFCSSLGLLFIPIMMMFYFDSIIKLLSAQPMRFNIFFSESSPHHGCSNQVPVWYVALTGIKPGQGNVQSYLKFNLGEKVLREKRILYTSHTN